MKKLRNACEARILEMPNGVRLMPGDVFEADEKTLANPGVKVLLSGGMLGVISRLAPSRAQILAEIEGAKDEADLSGVAQAAELAGLHTDSDVLAAFKARVEALRVKTTPIAPLLPPLPGPPIPAPPETKPEKA